MSPWWRGTASPGVSMSHATFKPTCQTAGSLPFSSCSLLSSTVESRERERRTPKMREQVRIINAKYGLDLKMSHISTILYRLKDSIISICYNHHLQIQKYAIGKRKRKAIWNQELFCNQLYQDEKFMLITKWRLIKSRLVMDSRFSEILKHM